MSEEPAATAQLKMQFTLRRAMVSLTLVAVGLALLGGLVREASARDAVILPVVLFSIWFGSGALIGAGVLVLTSRWWVGALLSIPIQIAMLPVLFWLVPRF